MEKDIPKTVNSQPLSPNGDASSRDEDPPSNGPSWLTQIPIWLGVIFLISTITLFELGQGFREGYFSGFSVDISQVPVSFHETLYWGYLANFLREVSFLLLILVILIFVSIFWPWLRNKFHLYFPRLKYSRGLTLSLPELGLILIIAVLVFGYSLAGIATNSGRELSGVMMKAFLT